MKRIVIAIGGNMISDASKKSETYEDQELNIMKTAMLLADVVEMGHEVIVTHGNGPQVGSLLLQQQANVDNTTNLPLNILTALTQGQIGVQLQHAILNEFAERGIPKKCVVIPTTVIVSADDPAFQNPSKPIGPFYEPSKAEMLFQDKSRHYQLLDKGYRRVVASPDPEEILEKNVISSLTQNNIVISVGGGGTPTIRKDGGFSRVDAVIDKDLASARLAIDLNADLLVILTNINGVYLNYKRENQELLSHLSIENATELLKEEQFGAGSMAPKVKAGIWFAKQGKTIITSPDELLKALSGNAGTIIEK